MKRLNHNRLGGWRSLADSHWQEHRPTMYRELVKAGKLQSALKEAAEATEREMDELMDAGFQYHNAWEAVRQTYLLLPQEEGLDEDEDDPIVNEGYELMKELTSLRLKVNKELDRINEVGY